MEAASVWTRGRVLVPLVNADSTVIFQRFVAGTNQKIYDITQFAYVPNVFSLLVFINGVLQQTGYDYDETSQTRVTLLEAPVLGDIVDIGGFVGISGAGGAGVTAFEGRTGSITLVVGDILSALGGDPALRDAPNTFTSASTLNDFTASRIKVPTRTPGDSGQDAASTAFVTSAIVASTTGVASFNTRTGAITLTALDISTALGFVPSNGNGLYEDVTTYGAVGDGATDDSTAINSAIAASVISGKLVYFPPGTYLTDKFVVTNGCTGLVGSGIDVSTIKFKNQAYAASSSMINASASTTGMRISDLTINTDAANFYTSVVRVLNIGDTDKVIVQNVRFFGRGWIGVYSSIQNYYNRLDNLIFEPTGGNNTFSSCILALHAINWTVSRVSYNEDQGGNAANGIQITAGSYYCSITDNYIQRTSTGAGIVLDTCAYCTVTNNHIAQTYLEGIKLVDSVDCSVIGNNLTWATVSTTFGITVYGSSTNASYGCIVSDNTIENSYAAGIAVVNGCNNTVIQDNALRNCGVRGTAAPGTYGELASLCQMTTIAGITNTKNVFKGNRVNNIAGSSSYGYAEFNNGAGATLANSYIFYNNLVAAGIAVSKYLISDELTASVADDNWLTYVPVLGAVAGAITSYVVNSARYKRRGREIDVIVDITITNNGTGATANTITLPIDGVTSGGNIFGRESAITGFSLNGVVASPLVGNSKLSVYNYDNTYPGGLNHRLHVQGTYEVNG